jgi:hypothetical protein
MFTSSDRWFFFPNKDYCQFKFVCSTKSSNIIIHPTASTTATMQRIDIGLDGCRRRNGGTTTHGCQGH